MTNRIIIIVSFLCLILISLQLNAQKSETYKDARGYLLYYCIKEQYNVIGNDINSPSNKDYSGSYYVQLSNLSLNVLDSLHEYYKNSIQRFIGYPKEGSYEPLSNMTCWTCFNLIEAKETKKYINRLLKGKK